MIKSSIIFFGDDKDEYGMPKPYNRYLVVSSPWQTNDSGVASALPLSNEAPPPNPPHKIVLNGGPDLAYEEMLIILRNLPQNKNLKELIDEDK